MLLSEGLDRPAIGRASVRWDSQRQKSDYKGQIQTDSHRYLLSFTHRHMEKFGDFTGVEKTIIAKSGTRRHGIRRGIPIE